jgi:hypothetical protein
MAYVGKEGYMLDSELRPGSQHCQKGTGEFIEGVKEQLQDIPGSGRLLFRLDSGNDSFDTLKAVTGEGRYCIIKRNKRRENDGKWFKIARRHGKRVQTRKGKKAWVGRVRIHPGKKGEILHDAICAFEVIERKSDSQGNRYLFPEIEVNSCRTNLSCGAEKVIALYRGHAAGEQFHSELKSDMGIERLPSGKLAVNKLVPAVAMNAYNTLKLLVHHNN